MALESIRQKNIYRGPSSSAEFNKRNAAILKDIHTLYEKLNENEESIEESMDIVLRENFFLQNHVSLLRQEIEKLQRLVDKLVEFETFIDNDAPMEKVLPKVYEAYETYYKGCTIRRLCQEMHNFYKERNVASLQQQLFTQDQHIWNL